MDIILTESEDMWILSGGGIYRTTEESLVSGEDLLYTLYHRADGIPFEVTANGRQCRDEDILYISGSGGVMSMNISTAEDREDAEYPLGIYTVTLEAIKKAIGSDKILENYGINPRMGKYHETGCIKCYKLYDIKDAQNNNMKCSCGGQIKKGVKSRIDELSTLAEGKHPKNRPHYQYVLPLAELLSTVHDKGVTTKYVQTRYNQLIEEFSNEIDVLINIPVEKKDSTVL